MSSLHCSVSWSSPRLQPLIDKKLPFSCHSEIRKDRLSFFARRNVNVVVCVTSVWKHLVAGACCSPVSSHCSCSRGGMSRCGGAMLSHHLGRSYPGESSSPWLTLYEKAIKLCCVMFLKFWVSCHLITI